MPSESRPKLLLLDTCGPNATLALAAADRLLAAETLPGRSASERLLPAIRSLAEAQGMPLAELAAVAIVHGPGSFTGVRVGVAAAKGLAEALNIPVVAISRLAVLAAKAASGESISLLDAGRRELYAGRYRGGAHLARGARLTEELLSREEALALAAAAPDATLIACEAAVAELLAPVRVAVVPELTAGDALPIARARFAAGDFDDIAALDANYVRRTAAQIFAKRTPSARVSS